jgi:hypothetical protein
MLVMASTFIAPPHTSIFDRGYEGLKWVFEELHGYFIKTQGAALVPRLA